MSHEQGRSVRGMWGASSRARREAPDAGGTWTLVSLDEQGRLVQMWHQHGDGEIPVRLEAEAVAGNAAPTITAQAFTCQECEALIVVSRPAPALS
jgi:hypothetical protein